MQFVRYFVRYSSELAAWRVHAEDERGRTWVASHRLFLTREEADRHMSEVAQGNGESSNEQ
jgi:hypothetical protein